ncbi:MAG: hypothetical protein ACTHKZ_02170 [Lysobacteraceae bacterium]
MRPSPAWCLSLLLLCAVPRPAPAQVRHCTTPEGIDVYTDRRCEDVGAVPALARPPAPAATPAYRAGCARTLRDLAFALQSAIDARDVNRLADSYLWTGLSTQGGYAVMDRLAAIAQRPLAGIEPVQGGGGDDAADTARQAPVALRLEQTLRDGSTPANTVLPLRRYLGCWWISF